MMKFLRWRLMPRHFFDKVGRDWEAAWKQQVTPWELQSVNPSFAEALERLPKELHGRALVPGCGSGFDLFHLHAQGWDVTGIDISATAIEIARANLQETPVNLHQGDFLKFNPSEPFDLIYDYLFFAAIDPSMRDDFATQFHALLRPKSGRLVTLLFPLAPPNAPAYSVGPPYPMSLDDYRQHFEAAGFHLESSYTPTATIKPRKGRELLAIWSRT
ncbi:unnamed protein product [Aphanomyces euteiches]|uniref:Methyltransferase domain-containing protein n=1 Tax=Aphanomyces euteiches TaxID=100861 RepID=A0A6G0WYQ4_9STRA|nr:hypothetical protein Ae201684_010367 [Aphanomyces euteiches]KAH9090660.1 hypothetical protein Ae201684P_014455 [Aphanomyces euteiches]KAH9154097.1 hypothetical protein AeRB84_003768 [Aphanomyces euteiches]